MIAEQPADAVRFLTRALARPGGTELSPRAEADLLTTRAEAHVAAGKPDLAMADLTRATTLSPEYFTPWLLKATLARRGGDLVTAEAALLKAAALAPDSADVELEAGNIASAKGDTALARQAWEAAAADAPDTPAGQAAAAALGRMNAALPEKPLTDGALPATPR
jgi:tetratricopeptide (TPR) repeat protein